MGIIASINHAELSVAISRPEDRASVIVSCDIEFTEAEVHAMNTAGLYYTLSCEVINKDPLTDNPVVTYGQQRLPREQASQHEHVVFDANVRMGDLHERLIGRDRLRANLTLKNEETDATITRRTEVVAVDLAA